MDNKYIKFRFTDAKLFPKNSRTNDVVAKVTTSSKGKLLFKHSKRSKEKVTSFREPITVHQISNMLHTLVGERPVPSFRKTFYKADEGIFDIANKSYIHIKSPKQKKEVLGEEVMTFITEFTKLAKAPYNSNVNRTSIQWFKVKKFLGQEFEGFVIDVNHIVGYDVLCEPFENLFNLQSKYPITAMDTLITKLEAIKKTPISNFLTNDDEPRDALSNSLGEKVVSGIDTAYFLDGEILVPYEKWFTDRMVKNTTNILDGGFVELVGVFYEDELDDIGNYKLVSDISDEKY